MTERSKTEGSGTIPRKLLTALPGWLRYLYYLRFSLMLWLFPLVLWWLNEGSARSLTGGILVPEAWEQYTCVGFFLLSAGLTALVIARVVVINGEERFELVRDAQHKDTHAQELRNPSAPPKALRQILNGEAHRQEVRGVILGVLPAFAMFGYMIWNSWHEGVHIWQPLLGLFVGTILAALFWTVVNILYYLMYRSPVKAVGVTTVKLGITAARTILFPRRVFGLPEPGDALRDDTMESAHLPKRGDPVSRLWTFIGKKITDRFGLPGYLYPGTRHLYEAQFFSIVALSGFVLIYLVIWPLTAPVPTLFAWPAIAVLLLVGAAVIHLLLTAKTDGKRMKVVPYSVFIVVFFTLVFPLLYLLSDAERFPVFASILVAVTMFMWILAGLAFFLDRFRVPVFTLILLIVTIPRIFGWDGGREEHYFSITEVPSIAAVPTPAEIVDQWLKSDNFNPDEPLIVVTATGGGLHASAWTAAVLTQLDAQFKSGLHQSLYQHVLLMSTVSGGSTGVMNYLSAQTNPTEQPDDAEVGASCSSLEAVGWGVIYHDLPATLFLPISWIFGSSSGVDDLESSPLVKDRTWSLRTGFERNLKDHYCGNLWYGKHDYVGVNTVRNNIAEARRFNQNLSLRTLSIIPGKTPAVVMNTTSAERGARFLLANYAVPGYKMGPGESLPAESFLQYFGTMNLGDDQHPAYPDLPLATAAQLSATFPYVSSAARFPAVKYAPGKEVHSSHFVDGGYYDNDGTASILEFMRYALDDPGKPNQSLDDANAQALKAVDAAFRTRGKHLRIILIEIRNSADDPAALKSNDSQDEAETAPKNLLFQLTAPLSAFWSAGHTSITARNRAALDLIEDAYADRLQVHQIVIADTSHVIAPEANSDIVTRTDPLNWSLTPKQRDEIKESADPLKCPDEKKGCVNQKYQEAVQWMHKSDAEWGELQRAKHPTQVAAVP